MGATTSLSLTLTAKALDVMIHQSQKTSLLNRWIGSRAVGSIVVASGSLAGTIHELYLFLSTSFDLLRGTSLKGRGRSLEHLEKAVKLIAMMIMALAVGWIAPSEALLPAAKSLGLYVCEAGFAARAKRALIGAGMAGLALAVYTQGFLFLGTRAIGAVPALPVAQRFTWPLVTHVAIACVGVQLIANRYCSSQFGHYSGCELQDQYDKTAELPFLGTLTSINRLVHKSVLFAGNLVIFCFAELAGTRYRDKKRRAKDHIKEATSGFIPSALKAIPFVAIRLHRPKDVLAKMASETLVSTAQRALERKQHPSKKQTEQTILPTQPVPDLKAHDWKIAVMTEIDNRTRDVSVLIASLTPIENPSNAEVQAWAAKFLDPGTQLGMAKFIDDQGAQWRLDATGRGPYPYKLVLLKEVTVQESDVQRWIFRDGEYVAQVFRDKEYRGWENEVPLTFENCGQLLDHLTQHHAQSPHLGDVIKRISMGRATYGYHNREKLNERPRLWPKSR